MGWVTGTPIPGMQARNSLGAVDPRTIQASQQARMVQLVSASSNRPRTVTKEEKAILDRIEAEKYAQDRRRAAWQEKVMAYQGRMNSLQLNYNYWLSQRNFAKANMTSLDMAKTKGQHERDQIEWGKQIELHTLKMNELLDMLEAVRKKQVEAAALARAQERGSSEFDMYASQPRVTGATRRAEIARGIPGVTTYAVPPTDIWGMKKKKAKAKAEALRAQIAPAEEPAPGASALTVARPYADVQAEMRAAKPAFAAKKRTKKLSWRRKRR